MSMDACFNYYQNISSLRNEMKTAKIWKHEMLVKCVDVVQSLTEIARQRMMEDGVETYKVTYFPGYVNVLTRTSS